MKTLTAIKDALLLWGVYLLLCFVSEEQNALLADAFIARLKLNAQ